MAKILILKGDKPNEESEAYKTYCSLTEVSEDDFDIVEYSKMVFIITGEQFNVYFEKDDTKIALSQYDMVYLRDFQGYEYERNCLALYLSLNGIKYLNSDTSTFQHISKLTQYASFAANNIPIPESIYASLQNIIMLSPVQFGYPFIVKSIVARSGQENYLIKNAQEMDNLSSKTGKFIAQRYIPNEGDYRVIVMGNRVTCVYLRQSAADDHRNNISTGGEKTYIDLASFPDEYKNLALRAARALNREICGVDLMINKSTGQPVILEANFNFGIRAQEGTISEEIYGLAQYLHEIAAS